MLIKKQKAPEKFGRDLQLGTVLEGTIQKSKGRMRVSVRLIRLESGETRWAEKSDGPGAHIFTVRGETSVKAF